MRNAMVLLVLLGIVGCAHAQTAPATAPAPAAALSPASSLDEILDALDARGKSLKDFTAKVTLADTDVGTGTESKLSGQMWMQRLSADDSRVHVIFDRKESNGQPTAEKTEYLLSGGALVDRDYENHREVTRQIL